MLVKRNHGSNKWIICIIFVIAFYYTLRVSSLVEMNGEFKMEYLTEALNKLHILTTPLILNLKTLTTSLFVGLFVLMIIYTYMTQNKKNIQENTHGSSEWEEPKNTLEFRDKDLIKNQIFTSTEMFAKDMKVSKRNRNVILLGRPGTGKSRYYFKPNILNADGETIIITDPKGELLRDCGMSLINKGYDIRVLNLVEKWKSDHFNPLLYIKKINRYVSEDSEGEEWIAEDDVMTLINTLMLNTKSETIESNTGDPFWERCESMFLQAIIYYVIFNYDEKDRNFKTVLELIRLAEPDKDGNSTLGNMFKKWESKDPTNIGIKQWKHFKVSASSTKMMSTIIITASARLSPFNIAELEGITVNDTMELNRIGGKGDEGRIAYFIINSPNDSTFNFIASIMYTQIFSIIDYNASHNNGSLATPCQIFCDEWSQLGVIPRYLENLAYVRGLNCGITTCLQSLSQLKKVYKDNWETALDCCDYILFMGSRSKETLEYMSSMLGKKTWYKKSSGRTYSKQGSSSTNWDIVGRELAFIDEIARMEKGYCILLVSGLRPFYSKMYDLSKHPRYKELFESWNEKETIQNRYEHAEERKKTKDIRRKQQLFKDLGLGFVKINNTFKARELTKNEELSIENDEVILSTKSFTDELLDSL